MVRKIEGGLFCIKTDTSWSDIIIEASDFYELLKYIAEIENKGAIAINVSSLSASGKRTRIAFKNDMFYKNWKKGHAFKDVCEKYGFTTSDTDDKVFLEANTVGDKYLVTWIKYDIKEDKVILTGNTDNCNLWFGETRPDLTPEKIINFVLELNKALNLKGKNKFTVKQLIGPEDWQDIAIQKI